ncbi:MAG: 4Fe-4S binding protein [Deltaproteobacteria bacterium]|nr:4Fe-4S binding protein [Deltaproteobacteria bacterium]MBW2152265.1 4Fe-4S binding protein [Deltaproteobacteria bacterium]
MAYHTFSPAYTGLIDRLNRTPKGAAPSELLYKILKVLFNEKEAEWLAKFPIRPFTVQTAARAWKMNSAAARKVLDGLADRGVLVDILIDDERFYCLPPPMAGFFEFSLMRVRNDIDQKVLSELFYRYITVEEDFIRGLIVGGETQQGRIFVNEPTLSKENALHVLDYERAGEVIRAASPIGVSLCFCRRKMAHLNRDCNAPKEICMTFNMAAASLIRHGFARRLEVAECLDLLQRVYTENLVQFGENVREGVNFICNCCKCCCEAMAAARRFGLLHPVHTTHFIARIRIENCTGCGKCISLCPVDALVRVDAGKHHFSVQLDESLCLGCGVCVRGCPAGGA